LGCRGVHARLYRPLPADAQTQALYTQTAEICRIAVEANADDSKFPDDWLFKHRWGKGKKGKHSMILPDGESATIKWVTVGGRTSAYVAELQQLRARSTPAKLEKPSQEEKQDDSESDLTPLSESDEELAVGKVSRKRKTNRSKFFSARAVRQKTNKKH